MKINFVKTYKGKLLCFIVILCGYAFAKAQSCATLISPAVNETGVSILTDISFDQIPDAVNYFVDLGTTPGGTDILNNFSVPATAVFTPPQGLPENQIIYITIRGFFDNGTTMACDEQSFTTEDNILPPECTFVQSPLDGTINVLINTDISWAYAPRATGYLVTIGTTSGASDILNRANAGNNLFFNIPFDLDPNTTYYVTIIPFNENGERTDCMETQFTTQIVNTEVPECTQLITPSDGQIGVALTPILEWEVVDNVDGYLIKVGSFSGGDDVLANTNIGLTTSTTVLDFMEGTTYYVTITPFNAAGESENCIETTFTTTLGCGPYFDPFTGETIDLNPVIDLEDDYFRCDTEPPLNLSLPSSYTTIMWYDITENPEVLLSENMNITLPDAGEYRVNVTDEIQVDAGFISCTSSHTFTVNVSQAPRIENLVIQNLGVSSSVLVQTSTIGNYEYSSVSANGPYQDDPLLTNIDVTNIAVFVRDKDGCGIDERRLQADPGFPKYFTPNGDGINDYWQVRGTVVNGETITSISIFDRYGKTITTIPPTGLGWDGSYNGTILINGSFWYQANTVSGKALIGHFALKKSKKL